MTAFPNAAKLWLDAILSGHYLIYVLAAPLLLAFGVMFNKRLEALNWRWLEWSPFHVKANVTLLPLKVSWIRWPYTFLLALIMPLLALLEEWIFRYGTTNWVRGILWGGIVFGVAHLCSFVSVRMVIYLTLVGILFVQVYMMSGLVAVWILHSTYNLIALAMTTREETHAHRSRPHRESTA